MDHGITLEAAGALDVTSALERERALLLEVLRSLSDDEWHLPTECPAYDVHGIAAHLLGDDLSLLSRQRDAAPQGLLEFLQAGDDFRTALDHFNDRWVAATAFLSQRTLIDLLTMTGEQTAAWYRAVDPGSPGERVGLFGEDGPSPYWQVAAREYVERWIHQHQIRRAVGREPVGGDALLRPALAAIMRAIAAWLDDLGARSDDVIVIYIGTAGAWSFQRQEEGWLLHDGRARDADAVLGLDRTIAATASSRGLSAAELERAFTLGANRDLAARAAHAVAAFLGRPESRS